MNGPALSKNPANIFGLSADRKRYESAGGSKEVGKEEGALGELVKRAKEGDRNAFGELYRIHHSQISRVARFSLGSGAEDAEFDKRILRWLGAPDAYVYFDTYEDATDEYRAMQALILLAKMIHFRF